MKWAAFVICVFLVLDAWMQMHHQPSFVWGKRDRVVQMFKNAVADDDSSN